MAPANLGPWLRFSPALGAVALGIYATSANLGANASFSSVFAVGLIVGAAASLVGALVGFLFGLPRSVERLDRSGLMTSNTNLEQVSDWLTKILLALGLVQLGKLADGMSALADSVGEGLGGGQQASSFALGLLIYSMGDGFLVGYLWTRLVVSIRLLRIAEQLAASEQIGVRPLLEPPPPLPPPPDLPAEPQPLADIAGTPGPE